MTRAAIAGLALFSASVPVSIFVAQIGYGVALIAQGIAWLGRRAFARTPLDLYLLGYVVAELVSFAFSQDHARNLVYMRRLLILPMFYVAAHAVRTERGLAWTLVPFLAVADLLSVLGIVRYFQAPGDLLHRVRFWQHVMTTSDLLMMADLVALGMLLTLRGRAARWASGGSLVIVSTCLVLTYSRSAWLGALAGLLVELALGRPRLIAPVGAGLILLGALAPPALRDRLVSAGDLGDPRNAERLNMWKAGIEIVRHHPWTGIGDIGTEDFYPRYAPRPPRERAGHLHSNWIQLAVTLGIPGLLLVVALFVRVFVTLVQTVRDHHGRGALNRAVAVGALGAYVGFQVMGLFEWNFGDAEVALTLWWLVGLAVGARFRE